MRLGSFLRMNGEFFMTEQTMHRSFCLNIIFQGISKFLSSKRESFKHDFRLFSEKQMKSK